MAWESPSRDRCAEKPTNAGTRTSVGSAYRSGGRVVRRVRQVLLTLVIAGSVFIAWTAIDAQVALPNVVVSPTHTLEELAKASAVAIAEADEALRREPERAHKDAVRRIWERARKRSSPFWQAPCASG